MKHIIFYSGGLGSWMTANRVIKKNGKENVILLFTDTKMEDEDLYRFLDETEEDFGIPVTRIADGRDVWEVFKDSRFIGNSRVAQCSHVLKQAKSLEFIETGYKPHEPTFIKRIDKKKKEIIYFETEEERQQHITDWREDEREPCKLYLGIDWTEEHRKASPTFNWLPYAVEFPMCEAPYMNKVDVVKELEMRGIELPRLYKKGFSHNNCGGFCVRAGQGHFINLLERMPERYKYHEEKEEGMRQFLGRDDVSILKRIRKGVPERLTLKQLREEHESGSKQIDMFDIGGCGCFVDD